MWLARAAAMDATLGWAKDCVAFLCFVVASAVLSRRANKSADWYLVLAVVMTGALVDGLFTLNPALHNTRLRDAYPALVMVNAVGVVGWLSLVYLSRNT
jgi:hypothetical protein